MLLSASKATLTLLLFSVLLMSVSVSASVLLLFSVSLVISVLVAVVAGGKVSLKMIDVLKLNEVIYILFDLSLSR
jgi:hypothetical protein